MHGRNLEGIALISVALTRSLVRSQLGGLGHSAASESVGENDTILLVVLPSHQCKARRKFEVVKTQ